MLCPCGSKKLFTLCCQAIINGGHANTAEQLMRSRYSAYATNNAQYIYDTYSELAQKNQSVADIAQWAKQCKWIKLTIHQSTLAVSKHQTDKVEFSAHYLQKNKLFCLRELSSFIKENGNWRYVDGDIRFHDYQEKIKANQLCPCGSTKKFKRCCGSHL